MAGTRSYTGGSFFFNLNGIKCGFVKQYSGGDAVADVIEEKQQPGAFTKKHLGSPRYEEILVPIDFGMAQELYDWIAASWNMNYARKDGSIIITDPSFNAVSSLEFFQALVTEFGMPALDASSKDVAHMTVKFAPELTRRQKASGKMTVPKAQVQKKFIASNFVLELDDIDCTRVSRIDGFTVKQQPAVDAVGELRDPLKEPGSIEFPNLTVTVVEAFATTWHAWHEDFVIKGNCTDDREKSGAIVLLAPDRKQELGRIALHGVGIAALRRAVPPAGPDAVSRVVAELYCERMELQIGKPLPQQPPEPPPLNPPEPLPEPIQRRPVPIIR